MRMHNAKTVNKGIPGVAGGEREKKAERGDMWRMARRRQAMAG